MKLGSLFDGSGGFPLAGSLCGIEPVWASEIEPYPIAVTKSRFPEMKHSGDISKVNGADIEPVDIITFGSPCQDLSVAGKRAGLKHEGNGDEETTRSGLFMEAVRIIKEMRRATNGEYPTFAIWENVPGAFSSNKGEDFRIVLQELIQIIEPGAVMPTVPKIGWSCADHYCGDGWSLAYRVLDAQFWGVPQRRRRIFLVVDFTGQRAGEILFERKGLRGYFETSRAEREGTATDAARSTGTNSEVKCYDIGEARLRTPSEYNEVSPTLTARCGTGGNNVPAILYRAIPIHDKATRYQGGGPTRNGDGAGNGLGVGEPGDPVPTLSTCDRHIVAYLASGKRFCGTLMANAGSKLWLGNQEAFSGDYHIIEESKHTAIRYIVRRLTPTECARLQGFPDGWGNPDQKEEFTDEEYKFWLDVRNNHAVINGKTVKDYTKQQMLKWYNKLHSDSSEYKMWGNGIALPCAVFVMSGIAKAMAAQWS